MVAVVVVRATEAFSIFTAGTTAGGGGEDVPLFLLQQKAVKANKNISEKPLIFFIIRFILNKAQGITAPCCYQLIAI